VGGRGGRKNLKLHVGSSEDSFKRAFQDENNACSPRFVRFFSQSYDHLNIKISQ